MGNAFIAQMIFDYYNPIISYPYGISFLQAIRFNGLWSYLYQNNCKILW